MRQLLQYGIKLGESGTTDVSPEALLKEAEVRAPFPLYYAFVSIFVLS